MELTVNEEHNVAVNSAANYLSGKGCPSARMQILKPKPFN